VRRFQSIVCLVLFGAPTELTAQSATPPRFVMACAPCHGFDGVSLERNIPNLAGQNREYLYRQLMAFRSGSRIHPTMNFFSNQATPDELERLVDYYAGLLAPPPP